LNAEREKTKGRRKIEGASGGGDLSWLKGGGRNLKLEAFSIAVQCGRGKEVRTSMR